MAKITVKLKEGYKLDGDGTLVGKDTFGTEYMFWRHMGTIDVPIEMALALEKQKPQRFEVVDRALAKKLSNIKIQVMVVPIETEPMNEDIDKTEPKKEIPKKTSKKEPTITIKRLNNMLKDDLLDFTAMHNIEANYSMTKKELKKTIIEKLDL